MIDIHCHLLPGVDDGAESITESLDCLKDLKKAGYGDIILTPHYINNSKFMSSKKTNRQILENLKKALREENIDINLYLGNEIYIDNDIDELLSKKEITGLNGTEYLLIELPLSGEYPEYIDIFRYLMKLGYKVILAHPERYGAFQEDFTKIYELEAIGVLFQSNLDSLVGKYGEGAKETLIRLLDEKKVTFLATDTHHKKHELANFVVAKAIALEHVSVDELMALISENAKMLINGN